MDYDFTARVSYIYESVSVAHRNTRPELLHPFQKYEDKNILCIPIRMLLFKIRILKSHKKNENPRNFRMVLKWRFRKARHWSKLSVLLHQTQDNAQQDSYIFFQNLCIL